MIIQILKFLYSVGTLWRWCLSILYWINRLKDCSINLKRNWGKSQQTFKENLSDGNKFNLLHHLLLYTLYKCYRTPGLSQDLFGTHAVDIFSMMTTFLTSWLDEFTFAGDRGWRFVCQTGISWSSSVSGLKILIKYVYILLGRKRNGICINILVKQTFTSLYSK
jgi:hypothetical protein